MKHNGLYPRVHVDRAQVPAVGQAGGLLLVETLRATGLDRVLSARLARWRKPLAVHHPGKIICDLAIGLALGGACLADIAALRDEPGIYGRVASDATVSRLIKLLGSDPDRAIAAIGLARKTARQTAWQLAGDGSPAGRATVADPLIIDLDATPVTAHSEKEKAAATFKHRFRVPSLVRVRRSRPAGDR